MNEPTTMTGPPRPADHSILSTTPLPASHREPAATCAVEELHTTYLDPVFRYVVRRLPQTQEAEDVTAEVFAAAVSAWPRYKGKSSPYVYLLGIARRKLVDHRRRQRWRELLGAEMRGSQSDEAGAAWEAFVDNIPAVSGGPEQVALIAERRRVIRDLMSNLKEEPREALLLRYVEGLSIADVADVLGKSLAATNSLLQRARQTLYQGGRAYFLDNDTFGKTEENHDGNA